MYIPLIVAALTILPPIYYLFRRDSENGAYSTFETIKIPSDIAQRNSIVYSDQTVLSPSTFVMQDVNPKYYSQRSIEQAKPCRIIEYPSSECLDPIDREIALLRTEVKQERQSLGEARGQLGDIVETTRNLPEDKILIEGMEIIKRTEKRIKQAEETLEKLEELTEDKIELQVANNGVLSDFIIDYPRQFEVFLEMGGREVYEQIFDMVIASYNEERRTLYVGCKDHIVDIAAISCFNLHKLDKATVPDTETIFKPVIDTLKQNREEKQPGAFKLSIIDFSKFKLRYLPICALKFFTTAFELNIANTGIRTGFEELSEIETLSLITIDYEQSKSFDFKTLENKEVQIVHTNELKTISPENVAGQKEGEVAMKKQPTTGIKETREGLTDDGLPIENTIVEGSKWIHSYPKRFDEFLKLGPRADCEKLVCKVYESTIDENVKRQYELYKKQIVDLMLISVFNLKRCAYVSEEQKDAILKEAANTFRQMLESSIFDIKEYAHVVLSNFDFHYLPFGALKFFHYLKILNLRNTGIKKDFEKLCYFEGLETIGISKDQLGCDFDKLEEKNINIILDMPDVYG
ncbi:uncharacterized protein VICG_00824 [Vittaforma corneae ATCC 50505]|uniref:Uncharacterized protein n=1 Tax=Vittaforma corneae (strain ATCC 50505) TaxID=993615 RepID=L2GMY3_VITCO|nr:uncharacterized protein VICG_00824 [Vittaforma corneae ATCC 50505]ELA42181.1 hypothetical protein VICG_00824 [Vittaforma corneae ATCC 50505]